MKDFKAIILKYYSLIFFLLVIFAIFGLFFTFQSFRTEYDTVREENFHTSYTGNYHHEARVVENTLIWREGEVLQERMNYFSQITPVLDAGFEVGFFRSPSEGEITLCSDLVIRSTGDDYVFWERRIELDCVSEEFPGRKISTDFKIDPENIQSLVNRIQESIGFDGGTISVSVQTSLEMYGEIDGEEFEKEELCKMDINLGRPTYSVEPESLDKRITTSSWIEVPMRSSARERILSVILFLMPMAALGFLTYERKEMDEQEIKKFESGRGKDKFEEWISRGEMPSLESKEKIRIYSLEDLVDLAVDLENRVIYDEKKSTYYVLQGEILYVYEEQSESAL